MTKSEEDVKQEALNRMKILKLDSRCVEAFKNGKVWFSERQTKIFDGILYEVTDSDILHKIQELKFDGKMVYHIQLTHTSYGDNWSMLYVDFDNSEWNIDNIDLKNKESLAYVYVPQAEENSEYGYIGIAPKNGGVARTY